ncbi:Las1-like-domain-containing protein [Lactarius sanguifluus]|nr:Las1-like-domain-containing protein [Lactarius sanguifluus]
MRLPRRVPWATLAQLEQVYSWVYSQDAGDSSRDSAIERLSAWKFMMPLPHALESLLSILVAIRQESTYNAGASSSLSLRQSYATAIIRLVNGLVDPLQLGTYARSISSIAAQIGLPAWLVELRHAATHEDLPSLELLRDGVKECLTWLLHHYFRPTLDPTLAHAAPQIRHSLRPAEPLLRRYKGLLKSLARDDDAARRDNNADVRAVLRELERWLAEARIAGANAQSTNENEGWWHARADDDDGDGGEPRDAWALDRLCEALLARGALVPLSRKKRVPSKGSRYPPPALLAIWTPLLENLAVGPLRTALSSHILAHLLAEHHHHHAYACPDDDDDERASYELCLAAWGAWLVDEWRLTDETDADVSARREDVFFQLVHALCTSCRDEETTGASLACQPGAQALLAALCDSDRRLAEISATVLRRADATGAAAQVSVQQGDGAQAWNETDLDIMDARLQAALSLADAPERQPQEQIQCSPAPEPGPGGRGSSSSNKEIVPLRNGWRLLTETDGWRPCPIGIYIGGR